MADFSTLESIFTMLTPSDIAGGLKLSLGGSKDEFNDVFRGLATVLENDGRGVLTASDLLDKVNSLSTGTDPIKKEELQSAITIFGNPGFFGLADAKNSRVKNDVKSASSVVPIIGNTFDLNNFPVMLLTSRSPFFHPAHRHTRKVEVFLNSLPPLVVASMAPYLEVEFQTVRNPSVQLQTMSQLKFLMGSVKKDDNDSQGDLQGANKALIEGSQNETSGAEFDFAGMEMFTSPQTMVNPTPNLNVGTDGLRYTEILDPFRPFASLESATITVTPAVGMYSYKKAQMVIKLHDRSRLAEISDLIRPQSYSNTTLWLTYGYRAPQQKDNPYFEFINGNMMMREAYGIINSNFSFDAVGQVTINLELFTKGVHELRTMSISDTRGDAQADFDTIKRLALEIQAYRKQLKLDPPEGINKEIRVFQVLGAAEQGEFPDLSPSQVSEAINALQAKKGDKDAAAVSRLVTALKTLYKSDQSKTKFDLKTRFEKRVTQTIQKKFIELQSGPDPFLPSDVGGNKASPVIPLLRSYYNEPTNQNVKDFRRYAVSFGKLFSVFAGQCVASANVVDELQVFFYGFNDQCGPISGHSIAEFPIDMVTFLDQYRAHVQRRGGEKVTLDEFLQLVVNGQVLDNRAIGYGLRAYYEPYDPKNADPTIRQNKENDFEKAVSSYTKQYGPFKKPVIEMYVETSHEKAADAGEADILAQLAYSAKDASLLFNKDLQGKKLKRIMRIHVYDKQLNPNKAAETLLRSSDGRSFLSLPSTDFAKSFLKQDGLLSSLPDSLKSVLGATAIEKAADDANSGVKLSTFTNARAVKDFVSRLVPTLTYGANGSTIITANLASKNDPQLSTVNMLRALTTKNSANPNGSGEGGIPLRVIPAQLTMQSMGCPLATMAQQYFIDFNTGTTVDNLYIVTGLTHVIQPGKFETQWQLGYCDAYGVFEGASNIVDFVKTISADLSGKGTQ